MDELKNKDEMLARLRSYAETQDDESVRYKEIIKQELLHCPELLYVLDNDNDALFNEDGTINYEGDWDLYFGGAIRPYMFFPEPQAVSKNFLCYKIDFDDISRHNAIDKIMRITFVVLCDAATVVDTDTGIARHDLIASILRERFHWSNIFGMQCKIVMSKESVTDNNYVTRTLILESTVPNSILNSNSGTPRVINNNYRGPYGGRS